MVLCDMRCLGEREGLCVWSCTHLGSRLGAPHGIPPTVYGGVGKIGSEHLKVSRPSNRFANFIWATQDALLTSACTCRYMQTCVPLKLITYTFQTHPKPKGPTPNSRDLP